MPVSEVETHPNPTGLVSLQDVGLRFDSGVLALEGVSIRLAAGEFVCVVGPSGCGKSSLLRLVAGLESATEGELHSQPAASGECGFVFQDPTLMPWASVFDNVWLPLRLRGVSRERAAVTVEPLLASVGLAGFADALPAELSGGMRMRASIARALCAEPRLLLMDEPFAALDEYTRHRLNLELLQWWQARRLSVLFVTHSVSEAVFLAQRVVAMSARPGRILAEFANPAPYPRGAEFRESPEFNGLRRTVTELIERAAHEPLSERSVGSRA